MSLEPVLELVTLEMLVSNLIGAALGLGVAWRLHRKASEDGARQFEVLARFLEQFARAVLRNRGTTLDFSRDKKGRIVNARINIHVQTARSRGGAAPGAVEDDD